MNTNIKCDQECKTCFFDWRNAQYNPDCFLSELLYFIDKKCDNINVD